MSFPTHFPPPITTYEFYVLLALSQDDAHAYRIKTKIWKDSLGAVKLGDGTIYGLVRRMCERGLIEMAVDKPIGHSGKSRITYSLGHHGRTALRYDLERLKHALAIAESAGLMGEPVPTDPDLDRLLQEFTLSQTPLR